MLRGFTGKTFKCNSIWPNGIYFLHETNRKRETWRRNSSSSHTRRKHSRVNEHRMFYSRICKRITNWKRNRKKWKVSMVKKGVKMAKGSREKSKLKVAQNRKWICYALKELPLQRLNLIFLLAASCLSHHVLWTLFMLLMFILVKIQSEIMLLAFSVKSVYLAHCNFATSFDF